MLTVLQVEGKDLVLGGDGRCDSPGFSAKYGSYSFMELDYNVVLHVELVQVGEAILSIQNYCFHLKSYRVTRLAVARTWKSKHLYEEWVFLMNMSFQCRPWLQTGMCSCLSGFVRICQMSIIVLMYGMLQKVSHLCMTTYI